MERSRKPLAYVPPEKFAEVRDRAKVKNIEIARELGVSPTRLTELMRTKGGTSRQYARVREVLKGMTAQRRAAAMAMKSDKVASHQSARGSRSSGSSPQPQS